MQVHGFRTLTESIYLKAGKKQYNLTRDRYIGLPRDAKILGITFRKPLLKNSYNEDGKLISRAWGWGVLTVKAMGTTTMVDSIPLPELDFNTAAPWGFHFWQPRANCEVDWLNSYVTIMDASQIVDGEVLEYTVYYACEDAYNPVAGDQVYYGSRFRGTRTSMLEVPIHSIEKTYKLYFDSNFRIPTNAYIVGMQVVISGYGDTGNPVVSQQVRRNSFLYIKKLDTVMISGLPLELRVNSGFGTPYFPIEPIKVDDLDTRGSEIVVGDQSALTVGSSFLIILHYICED